ncbi:transposase C of IS166 homeodomain protein [Brucella thiophenivorans]|uniref:Transposase C of IS166 homeodomain protein n=1 Tax=Brucella thiophenivorans TaxID=571255 RepID=A0A256F0P6_9HYPH|nr:transposase C of IS166 homeodomain protein [Brucella thiophenivorans]
MSNASSILPDDPAFLKAMITALQAENAKMSAALKAHDHLIQGLRLRIARLKKQVFGKSSEKIEREIAQLELALGDLLIASAEHKTAPVEELEDYTACVQDETSQTRLLRRRPRVSEMPFANAENLIPVIVVLPAAENCALSERMSVKSSA